MISSVICLQTYSNLAGSVIISDGNIHVWSGNADSSSQKTEEQLPNVNRWGPSATQYRYIIVSAGDGSLSELAAKKCNHP